MKERIRDDYDLQRLNRVVAFCEVTPRTLAEIHEACGHNPRVRYAIYNAVKHGLLENLRSGQRKGLYLAKVAASDIVRKTRPPAVKRDQAKPAPEAREIRVNPSAVAALAAVWGGR